MLCFVLHICMYACVCLVKFCFVFLISMIEPKKGRGKKKEESTAIY